jgi:hypothetical protein
MRAIIMYKKTRERHSGNDIGDLHQEQYGVIP